MKTHFKALYCAIFIILSGYSCVNRTTARLINPIHQAGLSVYLPDSLRIEYIMPSPGWIPQKLGLYSSKKWPKEKKEFRIKWADGDADIQAKTLADFKSGIQDKINAAGNRDWKFVTVTTTPDFIISFTANNQAWSYVGTDCGHIAKTGQVTMNLGWHIRYRNNEGGERFGTGCHEMLHALGYIHTLQSPACEGKLIWNKETVYAKYARMGWSRAQVDANVFTLYPSDQISDNGCDFKSIMCYSVAQGEANVVVGRNNAFTGVDNAKVVADYAGGSLPVVVGDSIISVGKPSKQSSNYNAANSYPSDKAFDGRSWPEHGANFSHTGSELQPWIEVDLQRDYTVSKIVLVNRGDCCGNRLGKFRITVTQFPVLAYPNAGFVYDNTTALTNGQVITIPVSASGRYVRLSSDNSTPQPLHISEFSVYGKAKTTGIVCDTFKIVRDSIVCR